MEPQSDPIGKNGYRQCLMKNAIKHLFTLLGIIYILIASPEGARAATVKNGDLTYDTLRTAYTAAVNGNILHAQAITFNEGFFLNRGIGITLRGGYDPLFSSNKGGYTTIIGPLVVGSGRISVDRLIINGNNEVVSVPNVVGQAQASAQNAIRAANLTAGAVTLQYSSTVVKGAVISQVPPAAASVDLGSTVTLVVSSGPAPIDLAIAKSHYGTFAQGQTGAKYTLTVRNVGYGPSSGLVSVADTLPSGLTATGISGSGWSCVLGTLTCTRNDVLAAGGSYSPLTLTVNVSTTAPGSVTNRATVSGGGDANPVNNSISDITTITTTNFQAGIQGTPSPLAFGSVTNGPTVSQQLTLTNTGTATLVVSAIAASGVPFSVFPPTSFTIAPGGFRKVDVGFAPGSATPFSGTLTVTSNVTNQPVLVIPLNGTGIVPAGYPVLTISPSLEFGAVMEDHTAVKEVTVRNTGLGPLTLSQANISGSGYGWPVSGTPALPIVIPAGQSLNLPVAFTPGIRTGGTTIYGSLALSSDGGATGVVLSGNAVTPYDLHTLSVMNARVKSGVLYDTITAEACSAVGGEVTFSNDSLSADTFKVTLTDQTGASVSSGVFNATSGAGNAIFSGLAACGLKDGTIGVTVMITRGGTAQGPMTGTPAVKNTSILAAPVLNPLAPATVFSTIQVCGTAPSGTLVHIAGGAGSASKQLGASETAFCLNVPLRRNTENLLIASATATIYGLPTSGQVATAPPVKVNQVDPSSVLIAKATSRPLTAAEIETLVNNGVITLNDPSNFNVSLFTIVLTIDSFPLTVDIPGVISPNGQVKWPPCSDGPGPYIEPVFVTAPDGQLLPGVIIIDGRIKTLKEFFQVTIALLNATTQFDLTNMTATIDLPGGLTPVTAGLGADVSTINTGSTLDAVSIGTIGPQQTGIGQFIIRGDGIGNHNVAINFAGFLSGGGLPDPFPLSGSAGTTVQVFGPPELDVVVRHPGDPSSTANDVTAGEIYTLTVEITNRSPIPALYASLDLLIGQGAELVDENGAPVSGSTTSRTLGTIQPGQTAAQAYRVRSLITGKIIACRAVASQNITLTVDIGGGSCHIANTAPANFQFPLANAPPTVMTITPRNNQTDIPLDSPIATDLYVTPWAGTDLTLWVNCLIPDIWSNVVTELLDPADPSKGLKVVSADLQDIGTFYLEELDPFKNPVRHIPSTLSTTANLSANTIRAALRPGLTDPYSYYILKPNTLYRATIFGSGSGICSYLPTDQWTFSTAPTCVGIPAPAVTLSQPTDGAVDRPLNQQLVLNFSNRMDTTTFTFDPVTPLSSSFVVLAGGTVSGGDVVGGTVVPGAAVFSNLFQTFTFTPTGTLPTGQTIRVRLKNTLKDTCGNPLQTPTSGVKLFSFTTIPPDTTPPVAPVVNPIPPLTNQSSIQVSGTAEPASIITITGGTAPATAVTAPNGLFSVLVSLTPNALTTLSLTARDASGNGSPASAVDRNSAPLTVYFDAQSPTLNSVTPANGTSGVALTSVITVVMSENITSGTVNQLTFSLEGPDTVVGNFTLNGANGFTFTPAVPLDCNRTYTVRLLGGGISDLAGNSLASPYVSTFTTESCLLPMLTLLNPASGVQGTTFTVTFTGVNLASATAVVTDNPGISGVITSATDTSVMASITITPQATTGPTTLGITSLGGAATLPFTVHLAVIPAVATHNGAADPTTEGLSTWSCCAGSTVGPINNDLGHAAWSIISQSRASQFGYISGTLSAAQKAAITSLGSVLSFSGRVLQGAAPAFDSINQVAIGGASFVTDKGRHTITLGLDGNGDTVVVLTTYIDNSGPGGAVRSFGPSYTLTGSGSSYHTYQLVLNPETQLADLFVDGVVRIQGYAGYSQYLDDNGLGFSVWSGGQGNFDFAQLTIGSRNLPSPTLTQLSQPSAVQGGTINVTFTGTKLTTVNAVISDNPGVSGSIIGRSDTSVTAIISVTPHAATGSTTLGLNTLGGSVTLPFTVLAGACVQPPSGLVSWWRGEGSANDFMGLNNGTISPTGTTFVTGKVGRAFNFDGSPGGVTIPNSPSLNPGQVTIEAWVRPDFTRSVTGWEADTIITKIDTAYTGYALVILQGSSYGVPRGTISFEGRAQTGPSGTSFPSGYFILHNSPPIPDDGQFHHVVGTFEGSEAHVYLDGKMSDQSTSYTGPIQASPVSASIGVIFPSILRYSSGAMDEVSLYNRALSESEILAIYNAGIAGKCQQVQPSPYHSCLDVRQAGLPDGTYPIDPDNKGTPVNVYCSASSPYVAPVGLCQAEAGATPACRSYVGAAGFNFTGVDFSKPMTYTGTVLTIGSTNVPGNRGMVLLADGALLTATVQSASLNKIAPGGTLTVFGSGLTSPHGITPLFDKTFLIGGVGGKIFNSAGIIQKSVNSGQGVYFTQSASGLVWAGFTSPGRFNLLLPDLATVITTVTHPSMANGAGLSVQLSNGNFVISNIGNSYPTSYGGSLLFLNPDLTPLTFTQPPAGMTLNADGTISHHDLSGQHELIQLPNGQILIADFWTNKIIRLNEDGSFVDELTLGTGCAGGNCPFAPSGMILDKNGRLLVSTGSNQVRVITFGP